MSILNQKKKVTGQIAALRVSAEGYPKKVLNATKSKIKSKAKDIIAANTLNFLIELQKSLAGYESLKETVEETLTQHLDEIEVKVKASIKEILKVMGVCDLDPSLPSVFKTDGITLELSKIDFLDILKVAPTSIAGKLLYDDIYSLSESTDFNTFLYNTIQDNGGSGYWGHVTNGNDILEIKFSENNPNATQSNNNIIVKPTGDYLTTKKLTDLNNDFIDSLTLFSSAKMVNGIIDSIFGSITVNVQKDKKTIEREIIINDIIDRIINSDDDVTIDDSYFSFSNDEYSDIQYRANLKSQGMRILETSNVIESTINIDTLTSFNNEIEILLTQAPSSFLNEQISTAIKKSLNTLAEESAINGSEKDKMTLKADFMESMLRNLMTSIVNVILSPKLITIFAINYQIVYGESFTSIEDFLKKNKWIITYILNAVRDMIIEIILAKVLKEIKKLVADSAIKTQIEKLQAKKAQMLTLISAKQAKIVNKVSNITKT